jgi:hypothetical protein
MPDEARDITKEKALFGQTTEEIVLLGQAGWSKEAIDLQVARICSSRAFDNQELSRKLLRYLVAEALLGRVPHPPDIEANIKDKEKVSRGYVRAAAFRLRRCLKQYNREAKPTEIRLEVPDEEYFVLTPRNTEVLVDPDVTPSVRILEPPEKADVFKSVMVRGRIDALHPDLRAWLVVLASDGFYYPQCRVSRLSPSWSYEVRIGRMEWGKTDGVEFAILLVAADVDGDFEFHGALKARVDGFGTRLPADVRVLDSRRVIRRDIRPEA